MGTRILRMLIFFVPLPLKSRFVETLRSRGFFRDAVFMSTICSGRMHLDFTLLVKHRPILVQERLSQSQSLQCAYHAL